MSSTPSSVTSACDLLFSEDSASHDAADAALNAYDQAVALVGARRRARSRRRPRR